LSDPYLIKSTRLSLRVPDEEDAQALLALLNQEDFILNIRDKEIRTIAQAKQNIIDEILPHFKAHGFCLYAMDTDQDRFIGLCGLIKRPELDIPDIGYALRTEFQNKGYVTEAGKAVRDYAFNQLTLDKFAAICNPENLASIAVLNKIGMRFVKGFHMESDNKMLKYFEQTKGIPIRDCRNLGPKTEQQLNQIGISNLQDIKTLGVINTYLKLETLADFKPSLNFLYALEGAIQDRAWQDIAAEQKHDLVMALESRRDLNALFEKSNDQ